MLPKVLSGFPGAVEETFLYNTLEYSISPMCSPSHEMSQDIPVRLQTL